ncbi:hypothetical protein DFA_08942 [Cavenderia fasciculata]|uniref:alpha-mannosidase n=1 Tax=Cavenderia fasciculata TaxID=261658 RepID=F4Q548_CACFS|nr:uncharacterized protein DFA_08942 [Cavenderia fasciculata]EGG17941.1 hypothetical protein DFA_08942 [Cavenderia fasciculata]|eukprot:XP_004356425.1 hypothetical protein DFA_08942 [Cavenderia fasciculata]
MAIISNNNNNTSTTDTTSSSNDTSSIIVGQEVSPEQQSDHNNNNNNCQLPDASTKWTILPTSNSPTPRFDNSLTHYEGYLYMFGGNNEDVNTNLTQFLRLDLSTNSWHALQCNMKRRILHTAVIHNRSMYVYGGGVYEDERTSFFGPSSKVFKTINELLCYEFETQNWNRIETNEGPTVDGHCAVVIGDNIRNDKDYIYVFGGYDSHTPNNDLWQYDVQLGTWKVVSSTLSTAPPRYAHSANLFEDKMYVYGGYSKKGYLRDLHTYDFTKEEWKLIPTGDTPPKRRRHQSVVVDTDGRPRILLYGGSYISCLYNDLWEYVFPSKVHIPCDQLVPDFLTLFNNAEEYFSDIAFVVEGKRIPAHRNILSVRSNYFKSLFTNGLKESFEKDIIIKDEKYDDFIALIRFIYTGDEGYVNLENCMGLLHLSDCYLISRLKIVCEAKATEGIAIDTVVTLFKQADFYKLTKLRQICIAFIAKNHKECLATGMLTTLESSVLLEIMYLALDQHGLANQDREFPQERLNVHLIMHSHDDAGWLKTFEEYYQDQVKSILSSIVKALSIDPKRRFNWSEIIFLERWWREQGDDMKQTFKHLVQTKQIAFTNGGWVQYDEACTTTESVIEHFTEGHRFIVENFGAEYLPKSGWQIDPFGHATKTAAVMSAMGYENIVLDRVSTTIKDQMNRDKSTEFVWRGSRSRGKNSDMFAHVLDTFYTSPAGIGTGEYPTLINHLPQDWANSIFETAVYRSSHYLTPHLLMTIGGDFAFNNSVEFFQVFDQTLAMLNSKTLIVAFKYSTVDDYFAAAKNWLARNKTPLLIRYNEDFFPLLEQNDAWTGYYTTKPALKRKSRLVDGNKRMADTLDILNFNPINYNSKLRDAQRNCSILLHHDAITGTSRVKVIEDYSIRLDNANTIIEQVSVDSIKKYYHLDDQMKLVNGDSPFISDFRDSKTLLFFNPLGWDRVEPVTIQLNYIAYTSQPGMCAYSMQCWDYKSNSFLSTPVDCTLRANVDTNVQYLQFDFLISIPALSFNHCILSKDSKQSSKTLIQQNINNGYIVDNNKLSITISNISNLMESIYDKSLNTQFSLRHTMVSYNSGFGGSYVLKLRGIKEYQLYQPSGFWSGEVMKEFKSTDRANLQEVSLKIYQTNNNDNGRLERFFDFIYNIQGIDKYEIFSQFETYLLSTNIVSDSGYEFQFRRPCLNRTLESCFYPSVHASYIVDSKTGISFVCLNDRSRGVASPSSGTVLHHLHRSMVYDDNKGLGQPGKDNSRVTIKNRCFVDNIANMQNYIWKESIMFKHSIQIFELQQQTASTSNFDLLHTNYSPFLSKSLPQDIHILSVKYSDGGILLRLMNIRDLPTSTSIILQLGDYFKFSTDTIIILPLNGIPSVSKRMIPCFDDGLKCYDDSHIVDTQDDTSKTTTTVEIHPMEIKTILFPSK